MKKKKEIARPLSSEHFLKVCSFRVWTLRSSPASATPENNRRKRNRTLPYIGVPGYGIRGANPPPLPPEKKRKAVGRTEPSTQITFLIYTQFVVLVTNPLAVPFSS